MKGGYILYNGKFHRENEQLFTGADLYRLNSGIRESFRTENNLVMFAGDNFNYLVNSLLSIGLPVPSDWNLPRFISDVSRLLNKNHYFLATRAMIHFIPGISGTEYVMSAKPVDTGFYPVNESSLLIDFYKQGAKASSTLHSYEPSSRSLWASAARASLSLSKHNLIISNSNGFACESIGGTFGYLSGETAFFPGPDSQGYCPPILGVVMDCAKKCGYKVVENSAISHDELLNADELFLIDNCMGIHPVLGLESRRYYKTATAFIIQKLSELARLEHLSG